MVATVDPRGRPRSRIVHPVWELQDGPASIWPGGPDAGGFEAIRLNPWRVQARSAAATAAGEPHAVWQDG